MSKSIVDRDFETEVTMSEGSNAVTAHAKPAESMHKVDNTVPGQSGSAEDLGGPVVKPFEKESIGKKVAARMKHEGSKSLSTKSSSASGDKQDSIKKSPTFEEVEDSEENIILEAEKEDSEKESEKEEKGEKEDKEEKGEKDEDESEKEDKKMKKEDIEINVEEDVRALLEGEELSPEFEAKAKLIFESAVRNKVAEVLESIEAHYQARLEEEVVAVAELLEERLDAQLDYATSKWIEENKLAIDYGVRNELTEDFMRDLKRVFEQNYIDIPEDKVDVLAEMSNEINDMESKLNEAYEVNINLNKKLSTYIQNGIFGEVSEGLADTQKEKLASLAESVEFESEEDYRHKLETLKESYFPKTRTNSIEDLIESNKSYENLDGAMAAYAAAISRWSK
jgi:hypothetical protein